MSQQEYDDFICNYCRQPLDYCLCKDDEIDGEYYRQQEARKRKYNKYKHGGHDRANKK